MNILIPYKWLLEHLDTKATPKEIQTLLSLSGPSIERIYERDGDSIFDIEITTNRVDSMSVRGVAREAAVILTQAGIPATLKPLTWKEGAKKASDAAFPLPVIKNDPELCNRILCVVLSDVQNQPSPTWMQERLKQIEVSSHDLIIDITNYITHDLGHPCHAFDYDRVMKLGGEIHITKATKGKTFTTLDGVSYKTIGGEVVFTNQKGEIIDLPAVKGTANTAITPETKNVLFWIESITPKLVRFASMSHAIRTVAAQLNEKGISPSLADDTFARGVELFTTLGHATIQEQTQTDIYPGQKQPATIQMNTNRITTYLGLTIKDETIVAILTQLGMRVELNGSMLTVTPPAWRTDIEIPEDIIEEIARIYGYHNLPSTLMTGSIPTDRPIDTDFAREHATKQILADIGFQEVYTYSMIGAAQVTKEKEVIGDTPHVMLKNPLSDEMVAMRQTLWSAHLAIFAANQSEKHLTVFELANVYHLSSSRHTTLPEATLHLTITSRMDMAKVKGVVELLAKRSSIHNISYKADDKRKHVIQIMSGTTKLGELIQLGGSEALVIADLLWAQLLSLIEKYPHVKAIPKFTAIKEDLTFTLPHNVYTQSVMEAIKQAHQWVSDVTYVGIYKRNVTFTLTYLDEEKQLNDVDAAMIRKVVVQAVEKVTGATLVGTF